MAMFAGALPNGDVGKAAAKEPVYKARDAPAPKTSAWSRPDSAVSHRPSSPLSSHVFILPASLLGCTPFAPVVSIGAFTWHGFAKKSLTRRGLVNPHLLPVSLAHVGLSQRLYCSWQGANAVTLAARLNQQALLPDMMFPTVNRFNPNNGRPLPITNGALCSHRPCIL